LHTGKHLPKNAGIPAFLAGIAGMPEFLINYNKN